MTFLKQPFLKKEIPTIQRHPFMITMHISEAPFACLYYEHCKSLSIGIKCLLPFPLLQGILI
jgi:hypothetical protein